MAAAPKKSRSAPAEVVKNRVVEVDQDGNVVDLPVEMKSVSWRGAEFTIPAKAEDFPADALIAFEEEHAFTAVKLILGEEQWERLADVSRRTARDVGAVFELLGKEAGFDRPGE